MDAYITGTEDRGLLLMELRPAKGVAMEEMENHLWKELSRLQEEEISDAILTKLKVKNESTVCFSNVSAAHKATNLAYYESLGDANLINTEAERLGEVTAKDIRRVANFLRKDNVNTLRLISHQNGEVAVETDLSDEEDE